MLGGLPWQSCGWDWALSLPVAPGSIPGWGTKILQAVWCSQKKKKNKHMRYRYYYYPYFTDKEIDTMRLSRLPKIIGYKWQNQALNP